MAWSRFDTSSLTHATSEHFKLVLLVVKLSVCDSKWDSTTRSSWLHARWSGLPDLPSTAAVTQSALARTLLARALGVRFLPASREPSQNSRDFATHPVRTVEVSAYNFVKLIQKSENFKKKNPVEITFKIHQDWVREFSNISANVWKKFIKFNKI